MWFAKENAELLPLYSTIFKKFFFEACVSFLVFYKFV